MAAAAEVVLRAGTLRRKEDGGGFLGFKSWESRRVTLDATHLRAYTLDATGKCVRVHEPVPLSAVTAVTPKPDHDAL